MPERTSVEFEIDGRTVRAQPGDSLLRVARREGFAIPSLCWHERLTAYGACRLCLVEVRKGKRTRIVTSCDYPVQEGLVVRTDTDEVRARRKTVVQLLAAMGPQPVVLRDLALQYGADVGGLGAARAGDCILCGLCVRVCREVVGACAVDFQHRGEAKALGGPYGAPAPSCISCGACASVCPVNARQTLATVIRRLHHAGAGEHPCRYTLLGIFSDGVCANHYECERCEVEHRLRDGRREHPAFLRSDGGKAHGG